MKNQNIAIIGAGVSGLAAAALLQKNGNIVTLFEKFDAPKPVGAGLLLQPTGLSVLSLLGLDQKVISDGSIIHRLDGKVAGSIALTLDVAYKDYASHLFGLGVQRGGLFSALYNKAIEYGVEIKSSSEINDVKQENGLAQLITRDSKILSDFHLVVDASGQKSRLRKKYADVKLDRLYPYGALWSIVSLQDDAFCPDTLHQRYKNADHMIGVLPVGNRKAAFFWSLKVAEYPRWREQPLSDWKRYVRDLWPETDVLLQQFQSHDDLTLATYSDVILHTYNSGNMVFIGDSAHCTSPQLGQGANLALVDALVLSECVKENNSMADALTAYTKKRKCHLWFYQTASRVLTPFFQSDSILYPKLRFLACSVANRIPFARKMAAHVLTGTKVGLFKTLNPGIWSKDYDLRERTQQE